VFCGKEQFLTSDTGGGTGTHSAGLLTGPERAPYRSVLLARLFRKRGAQLLQVAGIDVGNGPELQFSLTPTCHVIAIVAP
jgi:hypothetical protein